MKYQDIINACQVTEVNLDLLNTNVNHISIDTRTLQAGDVYIAIKGEVHDGHRYVQAAKEQGAIAAVVSEKVQVDIPQIVVSDTTIALGQIAAHWRQQFSLPIIAVTGSVGKTTTRNMIASILIAAFGRQHVLIPEKNYNNHWGLPLVLSRLNRQHNIAVLEMGMNHLEEIRYLMTIAQPTIGVVTNAGTNHIGLLGSIENIAKAKGEMFEELAPTGCAVINGDDRFYDYWHRLLTMQSKIIFGLSQANITAKNIAPKQFTLVTPVGEIDIHRTLLGDHNIMNALAATAAVMAAGIDDLAIIKRGLENIEPEQGRLEPVITKNGVIILNDTYNGGETSTLASLQVLSDYKTTGRKIAVIGDMAELEGFTIPMHQKMGEHIMRFSPDVFLAFGPSMRYAYDVYSGEIKQHFLAHDDAATYLLSFIKQDDVILLKGARAMMMEKIVEKLLGHYLLR